MRDYVKATLIGASLGIGLLWMTTGCYIESAPTPQFNNMDSDDVSFRFGTNDISREKRNLPPLRDKVVKAYEHAVFLQRLQVLVDFGGIYLSYGSIAGMVALWLYKNRKLVGINS